MKSEVQASLNQLQTALRSTQCYRSSQDYFSEFAVNWSVGGTLHPNGASTAFISGWREKLFFGSSYILILLEMSAVLVITPTSSGARTSPWIPLCMLHIAFHGQ